MKVLLVKLTSMGDLFHVLPALTDASRALPDIRFDWVIEKSFSDIASWHPAVGKIISTSHRIWKKQFWQSTTHREIKQFIQTLRQEQYDLVIDGQASIKSAVVTLLSKGMRCGFDRYAARESLASLAYQKHYFVDKNKHAMTRLRELFSMALGYSYQDTEPDYHIVDYPFPPLDFDLPQSYVVFVHHASFESKLWPEAYWRRLIQLADKEHLTVLLPWGNAIEKMRAERLARSHVNAQVLPFLTLSKLAVVLKNAKGVLSCDTGLSHLAAALNVKNMTLYGSTSALLAGTRGRFQLHEEPQFHCVRCYQYHCHYGKSHHTESLCMRSIQPDFIWERLKNHIAL